MRRPLLALVLAIAAIGVFTAGLAALLDTPRPPRGASRGERLYYGLCVTCNGPDGRGSWRASLFLIDRKSTRLNSSHLVISYAVFCLKKKKTSRTDSLTYLQCTLQ